MSCLYRGTLECCGLGEVTHTEALSVKLYCSRARNWAGVSFQPIAQSVVSPLRVPNP